MSERHYSAFKVNLFNSPVGAMDGSPERIPCLR